MEIEQLIIDARHGCSKAIGSLIESYQPMLLQIATRDLEPAFKAKVGASDMVQITCIDAAQSIDQFRGATAQQLSKWLIEILRNNMTDTRRYYRSSRRDLRREFLHYNSSLRETASLSNLGSTAERGPLSEILQSEATMKLERALALLSELEQKVVSMRNRDRMPFAEIGKQIDRSSDAARKIWYRAIERLQVKLQSLNG